MDQHALVCALKDLALELGKTPSRDEFRKSTGISEHIVTKVIGSYSALVQASGLDPARKPRKIDSSVFNRNLEQHLEDYEPRPIIQRTPYPRIASISDIHWPFQKQAVVDKFYRVVGEEQPEYVIVDGDARDCFSHGKFPRSHNVFTPREENELSRKLNVEFWQEIQNLAPKAQCVQMMGNHDIRPLKRALESYPEAEDWIKKMVHAEFTFPNVRTIFDYREELILGDIMIHHGYRSKLGDHRDYTHMNSIVGHTHLGGVVFRNIGGSVKWELNCGYAGDPEAKGLTYTHQKITHWTHGFGFVDEYGPRFIHL